MSIYQFEKSLIESKKRSLKKGDRLTVRRQQCVRCNNILALEITENLGYGGDCYVAMDCIMMAGELKMLYKKERWFGNYIRCPVCGLEGNLPMDKPLNWENMQKTREGVNA